MRVVVPYDAGEPNTRLDGVLDGEERAAFAAAMLRDVLDAVRTTGHDPEVLATAPVEVDARVVVDDRSLTPAVNAILRETDGPVAVVMADLALATPAALDRLFAADADVVLAPGRGGGTNAALARHQAFRVDYHGASYLDHRRNARGAGATVETVDSYWLATDVDEPDDLPELLVHGDGRAATWLRDAGFRLAIGDDGRVGVDRRG